MLCSLSSAHSQRKGTPKAGRMEPENSTCGPAPVELESSTTPTDRGRGLPPTAHRQMWPTPGAESGFCIFKDFTKKRRFYDRDHRAGRAQDTCCLALYRKGVMTLI